MKDVEVKLLLLRNSVKPKYASFFVTNLWESHVDEIESTLQTAGNYHAPTTRGAHASNQQHVL